MSETRLSHGVQALPVFIAAAMMAAGLAAIPVPATSQDPSEDATGIAQDLAAVLGAPESLEAAIQADIAFRELLHLDSTREFVESLYADPEATIGTRANGALLTEAELAELRIRDDLVDDADIVYGYYEDHPELAAEFAGALIDHQAGGRLAVYLASGTSEPWSDDLTHPDRLEIRDAVVSLRDLEVEQGAMDQLWEQAQVLPTDEQIAQFPETVGLVSTAVDIANNEVVLGYTELGSSQLEYESRNAQVRVEQQLQPRTAGKVWAKGGWSIGTSGCTFGFKVDRLDAGSAHRFMVTSGHCFSAIPTRILHNGRPLGAAIERAFNDASKTDVALVRIDTRTESPQFAAAAAVVHSVGGRRYVLPVEGKLPRHVKGTKICMTGRISGTQCGLIANSGMTIHVDDSVPPYATNVQLTDMVQVEGIFRTQGDSGSPAYQHETDRHVVRAAGVLSSELGQASPPIAYYATIQTIEKALPWNVVLATSKSNGCTLPGQTGASPPCRLEPAKHG